MNPITVIELLAEQNYLELQRLAEVEIQTQKSDKPNLIKARIDLSKFCAKENKNRPSCAGAFVKNGKQQLGCGYFACIYNDIVLGTIESNGNSFDFEQVFPRDLHNYEKANADVSTLEKNYKIAKAEHKGQTVHVYAVEFAGIHFNVDYVVRVLKTLKNPELYINPKYHIMVINAENGKGIVMGLRDLEHVKSVIVEG